jgi:hypothetical protein
MLRKVEIKVRTSFNPTGWEALPVAATFMVEELPTETGTLLVVEGSNPPMRLSEAVSSLAKSIYPENGEEVRWNFEGSLQGHYHFLK